MSERSPGAASTRTNRGRRQPPGRGWRCPVALGDRGRCVRARTLPLPNGTFPPLAGRRAERKRPIFQWKSGPAHVGAFPGGRLNPHEQRAAPAPDGAERPPPGRGWRCPVALRDQAVWVETVRDGRVTGLCRLGPSAVFPNAGLSGTSRSSGGRAAPLMRKRPPQTVSALTTEGGACPGWREAPAPRRGRRCPVALGDRAVWLEMVRSGRVTGPCRMRSG